MIRLSVPKTWRGFTVRLLIALVLIANDVVFWVWRSDKPPGNPGGPLQPMGGWVMTWDFLWLVSPWLIVPCLFSAGRFLREQTRPQQTDVPD